MKRAVLAAVLVLSVSACQTPLPAFTEATAAAPSGSAEAVLASLPVKGRAPATEYNRAQFGKGWADVDGDGCDSRREALEAQAIRDVVRKGSHRCVFTAVVHDPYTGRDIPSTDADVDHRVALKDAWTTGAQLLSAERREALANDPAELVAVDASTNRQKSDSSAASWLPPLKSYRCEYVSRQIAVKKAYGLWVTQPEHDAMARVLASCPGQEMPR